MAFNSLYFPSFLLVAALLFYGTKKALLQKWILVITSITFVSFFSWFSALILVLIGVGNFFLLQQLVQSPPQHKKSFYLGGIFFNVFLLVAYKLLQEVLSGSGVKVLEGFDNTKWIILGLGFYILQVIGYFFEVYKRRAVFDLAFQDFFLSLAFFSKLPAGPIINLKQSKSFLPSHTVKFKEENLSYGIQRILLGLFKKIALADRLLPYVHHAFDNHQYLNGLTVYLAPILFTLQLYFDFSGYIDIAIGSARIFGVELPENFNLPLRAKSITEFWRRWHITLVNWLTNYVFYPISYRYRKLKEKGMAVAVVCTFIISALWHGFALTFIIWAACHFTYIILEHVFSKKQADASSAWIKKIGQIILVWHLVAFSNIFFRSATVKSAFLMFQDLGRLPFLYGKDLSFKGWLINGGQDIQNEFNYRFAIVLSLLFLVLEKKLNGYAQSEKYNLLYVSLMLVALVVLGMFNAGERFIYLQF